MSYILTIDSASKSQNLDSNSILRLSKQNIIIIFMEIKINGPKLTQKQIAKQMGISDNTINRYRNTLKRTVCIINKTKKNSQVSSLTSSILKASKCDNNIDIINIKIEIFSGEDSINKLLIITK